MSEFCEDNEISQITMFAGVDFLLTLIMVLFVVILVGGNILLARYKHLQKIVDGIPAEMRIDKDAEIALLKGEIEKLIKKTNKPPIITMSGTTFRFKSGTGLADKSFFRLIDQDIIPKILENEKKFGTKVIEVIGHTDEVNIASRFNNLDQNLPRYLNGENVPIVVSDNAGLGLWRAATVARYLLNHDRLKDVGFIILPFSCGRFNDYGRLSIGESSRKDNSERRRIELRMKLSE